MESYLELQLRAKSLLKYSLPDISYPFRVLDAKESVTNGEDLPFALMLRRLQQRNSHGHIDWKKDEPAMQRLAEILAEDDLREVVSAQGADWRVVIGEVDVSRELVAIQRGDDVIAVFNPRNDGRLKVAVYRPLDATSAQLIIALAQEPSPETGVCLRANNWEYAKDCSASAGQMYSAHHGKAYLAYWQFGLGINSSRKANAMWFKQRYLIPRMAGQVAAELDVYNSLADDV